VSFSVALDDEKYLLRQIDQVADPVFFADAQGCEDSASFIGPVLTINFAYSEQLALEHSEKRHLLLSVEPVRWLFAGVDYTNAELLQFIIDLVPVLTELREDRGERLSKRGL